MKFVVGVILLLGGLVPLLGAIFKWDWMFKSRQSRIFIEGKRIERGQVLYGVIGIIVIIIALLVLLVPKVSQTITGRPDATVILSVESDGCTVSRTDVSGMSSLKNLLWKVTTKDYEDVATRSAYDEYTYRYPRSGEYYVVLQAWYNSSYVTISNRVAVNCSN